MIYFIGGAPRAGKSILGQQVSVKLKTGWISTDLLAELLRVRNDDGTNEWSAAPKAIAATAEKFFPYLERFVWGISSMAESYVIEGVNFLPAQVAQLAAEYPTRSVFLGCSHMTLDRFDRFPGRSRGYANLPDELRRQIVHDVPLWSEFIRLEAARFGYQYIDMIDDYATRQLEAEAVLIAAAALESER